jgi:hypothetical protein
MGGASRMQPRRTVTDRHALASTVLSTMLNRIGRTYNAPDPVYLVFQAKLKLPGL